MTNWTQRAVMTAILVAVLRGGAAANDVPANATPELVGEYGVTLALAGRLDEAETAFLSQLSLVPQHAGALNNIGNLYFLRQDVPVARVFYERAAGIDSLDPGILVNRSLVHLALGEEPVAAELASRAIALAGGLPALEALMAMPSDSSAAPASRAAEGSTLSSASVRDLLRNASRQVPAVAGPAGGTAAADSAKAGDRTRRRPDAWRSAGPRAAESGSTPTVLYWKQ